MRKNKSVLPTTLPLACTSALSGQDFWFPAVFTIDRSKVVVLVFFCGFMAARCVVCFVLFVVLLKATYASKIDILLSKNETIFLSYL